MTLKRKIIETLRPDIYHGRKAKAPFFEGWYFKLVDAAETQSWAVIPGIYRDTQAHLDQAFVMVVDGEGHDVAFHRYPVSSFRAAKGHFYIQVGPSLFAADYLTLNLPGMSGHIRFIEKTSWPVSWRAPGIMGWYAWFPMECYHGVVSLDHGLDGELVIVIPADVPSGTQVDFEVDEDMLSFATCTAPSGVYSVTMPCACEAGASNLATLPLAGDHGLFGPFRKKCFSGASEPSICSIVVFVGRHCYVLLRVCRWFDQIARRVFLLFFKIVVPVFVCDQTDVANGVTFVVVSGCARVNLRLSAARIRMSRVLVLYSALLLISSTVARAVQFLYVFIAFDWH